MNRLTALLFCLSALAVSHAQVISYGLSVEVVAEHDAGVLAGMTTYHLYMAVSYTHLTLPTNA